MWCVFLCVCVCVCSCLWVHICAGIHAYDGLHMCLPSLFSVSYIKASSLINPELNSASLVTQLTPGISSLPHMSTGITGRLPHPVGAGYSNSSPDNCTPIFPGPKADRFPVHFSGCITPRWAICLVLFHCAPDPVGLALFLPDQSLPPPRTHHPVTGT